MWIVVAIGALISGMFVTILVARWSRDRSVKQTGIQLSAVLVLLGCVWVGQLFFNPLYTDDTPSLQMSVAILVWVIALVIYLWFKFAASAVLHGVPLLVLGAVFCFRALQDPRSSWTQKGFVADSLELLAIAAFAGTLVSVPYVLFREIISNRLRDKGHQTGTGAGPGTSEETGTGRTGPVSNDE